MMMFLFILFVFYNSFSLFPAIDTLQQTFVLQPCNGTLNAIFRDVAQGF